MAVRQLLLPGATGLAVALIILGRFHATLAFAAALAGLALLALYPMVSDRVLILFALLPAAAWLASRPPWGSIATAVILAGTIVLVLGRSTSAWGREAWSPLLAGAAGAALSGLAAREYGFVADVGDAVALVIVLAAFRASTAILSARHWLYGMASGISTAPHLGPAGLVIGAVEAVSGLAALAAPPRQRIALVFGAPLALVALL